MRNLEANNASWNHVCWEFSAPENRKIRCNAVLLSELNWHKDENPLCITISEIVEKICRFGDKHSILCVDIWACIVLD